FLGQCFAESGQGGFGSAVEVRTSRGPPGDAGGQVDHRAAQLVLESPGDAYRGEEVEFERLLPGLVCDLGEFAQRHVGQTANEVGQQIHAVELGFDDLLEPFDAFGGGQVGLYRN